jgi:lipid-binding SYLF domain-containing protein
MGTYTRSFSACMDAHLYQSNRQNRRRERERNASGDPSPHNSRVRATVAAISGRGRDTKMRSTRKASLTAFALVCAFAVAAHADDDKKVKEQKEVRKMAQDTLQRLYKADPKAKPAVEKAAGYAVFSNMGVKILLAGSGKGQGIAVDNKSKNETFMKMVELQAGLGMGVKKFRVIFVFDNQKALNSFVNSGWEFGGQTTAAAKTGDKGGSMSGAASVSDGVWMYQLTDKGLAAEITAKSTKYYKDDDLN